MDDELKVEWTEQASADALVMAEFIRSRWTEREVANFYALIDRFERNIVRSPRA